MWKNMQVIINMLMQTKFRIIESLTGPRVGTGYKVFSELVTLRQYVIVSWGSNNYNFTNAEFREVTAHQLHIKSIQAFSLVK